MAWTEVQPQWQRDPQWCYQLMGRSRESTVGLYGCLITDFGMLTGRTPTQINAAMLANNCYATEPGKEAYAATFDVRQITKDPAAPEWIGADADAYPFVPYPLVLMRKLINHLRAGQPAIIRVDAQPGVPGDQQHWVLGIGAYGPDDGRASIIIADPYYGDQVLLAPRYGVTLERALVRAVYYRGAYVNR